jgi:hypothetical protein
MDLLDRINMNARNALQGIGQLDDEVERLRDIITRAKTAFGASALDDMCEDQECNLCTPRRILEEA